MVLGAGIGEGIMAHPTDKSLSFPRLARACKRALAAMGVQSEAFPFDDRMRWIVGFVAGCTVLVGVALLILWAQTGFEDLGVSGHGLVALILGIVFTTGLGIALMALSFYSDRSSQHEDVERSGSDGGHDVD
jgi:drug/metabolite transporter (DMT)-like permease